MDCLEHRISAENAMTTCRPDIQAQECEEAVSRAREAAALGASLASTYPEISAFVVQAAREAELYCDAVARAARGAMAFFVTVLRLTTSSVTLPAPNPAKSSVTTSAGAS